MLSSATVKINRNRLELRDHNQAGGVGRLHEVPLIHQAQPDPPADRRGDAGVDKLHFNTLDQSLIVFDGAFELVHQGYLRIVLLPWNCILLDEHCETLEIEARVVQQSLVTRQLSLELGQLGLEWARVDFSQQVAGTNDLAFLIPDAHELPVDLSLDCHSVERGNRAEAGEVDGDGTGFCCYCGNRDALRAGNRPLGCGARLGSAGIAPENVGNHCR